MNDQGRILRALRIKHGDTISQFANETHISISIIRLLENDTWLANDQLFIAYSRRLGIKASTIKLLCLDKEQLKHTPFIKRLLQPLMKRIVLKGID